jgi:soluble lytic murein transglycosylase-like protein
MKTHMTIAEYFDKAGFQLTSGRLSQESEYSGQSAQNEFKNVLNRVSADPKTTGRINPWKMNLSDYRASAVRAMARAIPDETQTGAALSDEETADETQTTGENVQSGNESVLTALKQYSHDLNNISGKTVDALPAGISGRQKIDSCIENAALKYNLPKELIHCVIRAESGFRSKAVSRSGAMGLMQLMPGTARELGVSNPFDIEQNIDGGTRYLKKMLDQFDGDVKLALAGYNAGPGAVEKYRGIPPYKETIRYVDRVLNDYRENV